MINNYKNQQVIFYSNVRTGFLNHSFDQTLLPALIPADINNKNMKGGI
jgi:hypothetical protein